MTCNTYYKMLEKQRNDIISIILIILAVLLAIFGLIFTYSDNNIPACFSYLPCFIPVILPVDIENASAERIKRQFGENEQ